VAPLTKTFRFDIKADAEQPGRFTGRASVYGVKDYYGDVVMPGAFKKTLEENGSEVVLLSQHDTRVSIGKAKLQDSDTALLVDGRLVLDLAAAKEDYIRLQHGLLSGLSIGYEVPPGGDTYTAGVRQLNEIKLHEVSLVTFPANTFARVTDVKAALASVADDRLAYLVLQVLPDVKAGRVLSAANYQKLADIVSMLQDLLASAKPQDDEKARKELLSSAQQLLTTMRSLTAAAKE